MAAFILMEIRRLDWRAPELQEGERDQNRKRKNAKEAQNVDVSPPKGADRSHHSPPLSGGSPPEPPVSHPHSAKESASPRRAQTQWEHTCPVGISQMFPPYFSTFPPPRASGHRRNAAMPLGLWTPPFPFSSRSNQAAPQPLLYLLHFHGGSQDIPLYRRAFFS